MAARSASALVGRRLLVVEDDFLIAGDLRDDLTGRALRCSVLLRRSPKLCGLSKASLPWTALFSM